MTPPAYALVGLVRAYQWTIRPVIGPNCRFWPSCSDYAVEAVRTHGALAGSGLAGRRILRCNPWHPGGYDPVPPSACEPQSSIEDPQGRAGADGGETPAPSEFIRQRLAAAGSFQQRRKAAGIRRRPRAAGPDPKAR